MPIKYTFKKGIPIRRQKQIMSWHVINVERDVYPKSIKRTSRNVWNVNYKTDGMTSKAINKHLYKKGYFKVKKGSPLKSVKCV